MFADVAQYVTLRKQMLADVVLGEQPISRAHASASFCEISARVCSSLRHCAEKDTSGFDWVRERGVEGEKVSVRKERRVPHVL